MFIFRTMRWRDAAVSEVGDWVGRLHRPLLRRRGVRAAVVVERRGWLLLLFSVGAPCPNPYALFWSLGAVYMPWHRRSSRRTPLCARRNASLLVSPCRRAASDGRCSRDERHQCGSRCGTVVGSGWPWYEKSVEEKTTSRPIDGRIITAQSFTSRSHSSKWPP